MTHTVINKQPFTVEYREGDKVKKQVYSLPLLPSEIKAEYPYITFDEPAAHEVSFNLMEMPVITLSNGIKVGNFSSQHPFKFVGETKELPAVSEMRSTKLSVDMGKRIVNQIHVDGDNSPMYQLRTVEPRLTPLLHQWIEAAIKLWRDQVIDVCLCPLPMLVAMSNHSLYKAYIGAPFVCIDRDRNGEIFPNSFTIVQ